jgi:hypothetical protein
MYAWENPGVPVDEVVNDVIRAFHHPAARNEQVEIQREMFETVRKWTQETPHRHNLDQLLSSESVKNHQNHVLSSGAASSGSRSLTGHGGCGHGDGGHGKPAGSLWAQIQTTSRETRESAGGSAGVQHHAPQYGQAAGYYGGGSPQPPPPQSGGYAGSYGHPTPPPAQPPYGGHHQGGYPGQGGYGQQQHPQQPPPPQPHYGGGQYPPQGQGQWGQYPRY